MSLQNLPQLREALDEAGILAAKRFGQHFLLDLNICRKIVKIAEISDGQPVLEVGPGPGGLTRALLETGARVVAIEKDRRFAPMLEALAERAGGRLVIIEADALGVGPDALPPGAAVVANLPYNIATPLLIGWLVGPWRPPAMTLMFQKEVAERITAPPGGRDYGRLTVLAQALCEARQVLSVPARAFTPAPNVDSAVVRLTRREWPPDEADLARLQRVTAAAFGQRRKMLRASLRPLGGERLCAAAGLDPTLRAGDIEVGGYLALARALGDA